MTKIRNIFTFALAAISISSCQMLEGEDKDDLLYGDLQLKIEKKEPGITRAAGDVNTDDFQVSITNASNYNAEYVVKNIPETITLPVGEYSVSACSPIEFQKKMSEPYFSGTANLTIKDGVTTQTVVNCKQLNSKISVNYGEAFCATYSEWVITIDDGSNTVLLFDNTENNPNTIYWQFGDNVKTLRVNITATPADGSNKVKGSMTITKADATERYDDDNENYSGGDAITLNFGLGDADETITNTGNGNISISVNAKFENFSEMVSIPVVWEDDNTDTDDSESGGQTVQDIHIVFSANNVSYSISAQDAPSSLNAEIETPKGMASTKVKIETTCQAFKAALEDLVDSELNLLNGHELVGDEVLPFVFSSLGLGDIPMPAAGSTSYTFPIATFFPFIEMYMEGYTTADFNFLITVTDQNGNKKEETLKLTINQ